MQQGGGYLGRGGDKVKRLGKRKGSKLRNLDTEKHTTCVYSKELCIFFHFLRLF